MEIFIGVGAILKYKGKIYKNFISFQNKKMDKLSVFDVYLQMTLKIACFPI